MKHKTEPNGFTLIEVLIAIAIFAIGMLAIGSMQLQATSSNTTARLSTELGAFATDQMEKLVRVGFDDLPTGDLDAGQINTLIGASSDDAHYLNNSHITADGWFKLECTVTEDDIIDNTKTLTLTAEEIKRSKNRRLTLQHVIPQM